MLSYLFLLALLAPAWVSVQATEGIRQCTGERSFVQDIEVLGCAQTPCDVFQGSDAIMYVQFRAHEGANTLRPQVFATALGATIEYTLPPQFQNGCNHLIAGSCPLAVNEDATFHFVFSVTTVYPPIPVSVELSLFNQNNQVVFCAIIDIHVRIRQGIL